MGGWLGVGMGDVEEVCYSLKRLASYQRLFKDTVAYKEHRKYIIDAIDVLKDYCRVVFV